MATAGSQIKPVIKNHLDMALKSANLTVAQLAFHLRKDISWVKSVVEGTYVPTDQEMGNILMALKIYPTSHHIAMIFPHTEDKSVGIIIYVDGEE